MSDDNFELPDDQQVRAFVESQVRGFRVRAEFFSLYVRLYTALVCYFSLPPTKRDPSIEQYVVKEAIEAGLSVTHAAQLPSKGLNMYGRWFKHKLNQQIQEEQNLLKTRAYGGRGADPQYYLNDASHRLGLGDITRESN